MTQRTSTDSGSGALGTWEVVQRVAADFGQNASGLSRLKAVVGVLTSVAFLYVFGGVVLALELDVAGFPVENGLQVMPPQRLLFTGIRELVLSALVGAILVGLMLAFAALPGVPRLVAVIAFPLTLALFVPLNAGGLSWPIALMAVGGMLLWLRRRYEAQPGYHAPLLAVALWTLVAIMAVTLTRYMVPPIRIPNATVEFEQVPDTPLRPPGRGGFLVATSDFVYLAHRDDRRTKEPNDGTIEAFSRDTVVAVRVGQPPPTPDPQPSLLGVVTGVDVAVTPLLDLWTDDHHHGLQVFR